MSLCIAAGGTIVALAANAFSLTWTHSVEKTRWQEHWIVTEGRLRVVQATVQGPGAGIDVPHDALRTDGGWTYTPGLAPLETLSLTASGMTASPWTLCTANQCLELGATPGEPVTLWVAGQCGVPDG